MVPSPSKKNSGLTNPRLRMYIDFLKKDTIEQLNLMKSHFDQQDKKLNELMERVKGIRKRSAGLEQEARQPCLTTEADAPTDIKIRKRTKDAAEADRVMSGDNSLAEVDPDPICLASFGEDCTGPPAYPCTRDDALVDNGAEVPKPCLSPAELRTLTAADGLLPTGKDSTTERITYHQPRLRFCPAEETISERTSTQYVSYYSSFWRINNQLFPFWRRVIETKSRQTLVFDPGGFTGRLRACPFLGTWRALLCEELFVRALDVAGVFLANGGVGISFSRNRGVQARRKYRG